MVFGDNPRARNRILLVSTSLLANHKFTKLPIGWLTLSKYISELPGGKKVDDWGFHFLVYFLGFSSGIKTSISCPYSSLNDDGDDERILIFLQARPLLVFDCASCLRFSSNTEARK